jgi:hypothetical protein
MLMDCQNHQSNNGYPTKNNLHVIAIPTKIPKTFIRDWKINLKVNLEAKRARIVMTILTKKRNAVDSTILNFKLYYRAIAINTAWYWYRNRCEDHWAE